MLWPLPAHFLNSVAGDNCDAASCVWYYWFAPYALATKEPYFHSGLFLAPYGIDTVFFTNEFLMELVTFPLSLLGQVPAAYNIGTVLSLALSAWCFFLFCRETPLRLGPALAGGFAYGFSPHMFSHLPGHFNLLQAQYVALVLLFWRRAVRDPRFKWTTVIGLGMSVWAMGLTNVQLFVNGVLLACVLTAALAVEDWRMLARRIPWLTAIAAACISIALMSPWFAALSEALRQHDYRPASPWLGGEHFARPLDFLKPPPYHALWGKYFHDAKLLEPAFYAEKGVYLGWICLAAALFAFVPARNRRSAIVWAAGLLVFLSLALGNRYSPVGNSWQKSLMLAPWLPRIALFEQLRVPARYAFGAGAICALLAAMGIQALTGPWPKMRRVLPAAAAGLIALDFLGAPIPLCEVRVSPLYRTHDFRGDGALLTFPIFVANGGGGLIGLFNTQQIIDQTHHHKPILSCYASRIPEDVLSKLKSDEVLAALLRLQEGKQPGAIPPAQGREWAKRMGIRWAVLQYRFRRKPEFAEFLRNSLGMKLVGKYSDGDVYGYET